MKQEVSVVSDRESASLIEVFYTSLSTKIPLFLAFDRTTAEFLDWLKGRDGRATADALVKRADQEREAELAALWRRLPALEPETRGAIEEMTRHLATRLLRAPLERLGRDVDGRDERVVRDIFAL